MHTLIPYSPDDTGITLSAEIERKSDTELQYTFIVSDPQRMLRNAPCTDSHVYRDSDLIRAHELWKDTCFELFWSEAGSESYRECNATIEGKWNIYTFESYRNPVPPVESLEYRVEEISLKGNVIDVHIRSKNPLPPNLECSLTAILNTEIGECYHATAHKGTKPDYHVRESFVVKA